MDYHFQEKTVPQLVHLIGGQAIEVHEKWDSDQQILKLSVYRNSPPNEDKYVVTLLHVTRFDNTLSKEKEVDVVNEVEFDLENIHLKIKCESGEFNIQMEQVNISARGTKAPSEN